MRRKDREVTDFSEIVKIIDECNIIRIGLADGDFPYIVPLNFGYTAENRQISFFIHGAMAGRKYEMLTKNSYCSFEMDIALKMDCMVDKKDVTMRYKSVMGKAKVTLLEGGEKQKAIDEVIMNRYEETRNFVYDKAMVPRTAVFKLDVIEISAKSNPLNSGADISLKEN